MNKILFRASLSEYNELDIAKKYFDIIEYRSQIQKDDLIIGRYSVLPYYRELEVDTSNVGGTLINSFQQHQMVSDIINWYDTIQDITPKTWFSIPEIPSSYDGPFFVKGRINSRKQLWNTHAFAKNRADLMSVYFKLMEDSLIQHQGVCIRKFETLVNFGINEITHCPVSKEFRIFILDGKILDIGYYWSEFSENSVKCDAPKSFIDNVVKSTKHLARFFVVDIAQKQNGDWVVIELGDAQMAGVSCCDVEKLYRNIKEALG